MKNEAKRERKVTVDERNISGTWRKSYEEEGKKNENNFLINAFELTSQ